MSETKKNFDKAVRKKIRALFMKNHYFSADKMNMEIPESFSEVIDEDNNFNMSIFFEISFYHILFFAITGPLTPFLMFILMGNMTLARNLGFFGFSINFCIQSSLYCLNFIAIFGFFFTSSPKINKYETIIVIGGLVMRAFIIAIKYALFSEKKIM